MTQGNRELQVDLVNDCITSNDLDNYSSARLNTK